MSVRIKSTLPRGHRDGLQHLTEDLTGNPERSLAVVMICRPSAITENLSADDDPYTVTLAVEAIEAPAGLEQQALISMLTTTYESRTGRKPLPFGTVLDFEPDYPPAGVDPDTGEITPEAGS